MGASRHFAAVDLGSNSFHMIIAREEGDQLHIVDRLRDMVQLGAGIDGRMRLSAEAQQRALECLERFGQRLRDFPEGHVRAVGTNTLRNARNAGDFLRRAEAALGHPIEVIAGREEARLIYRGVSGTIPDDGNQRLVVDIGGGSTEYIIGLRDKALYRESLQMGCVGMTRRHFPTGRVTKRSMRAAELDARRELQVIDTFYRSVGWQTAIGSSGTVNAIHRLLIREGWSSEGINRDGLEQLKRAVVRDRSAELIAQEEASARRAAVLPGGIAILSATFDVLGIEQMRPADSALREGLLFDMIGRSHREDVHETTIASLIDLFRIDRTQSERVERTALALYRQLSVAWRLNDEYSAQLLAWASRVHEIGLFIAHDQFHRHGAYLLSHADLAGFTLQEQLLLATLVRGHRRKFPRAEFDALPEARRDSMVRICALLRIAVLLNRARGDSPGRPEASGSLEPDGHARLSLRFGPQWLDDHPMTAADLDEERQFAKAMQIELEVA